MKTQSEIWFELFCKKVGWKCHRISEGKNKVPDYKVFLDDKIIIIEVKEFSQNKNEKEDQKLLDERGYGKGVSGIPGDRARKKISDSSAQIKAGIQGIYPSILVLCDIEHGCGQVAGHTDSYNIRVGMYGLEQIHFSVSRDSNVTPYITGISYGPKKKMTSNQNKTISAIGVLSTPTKNNIRLDIYHNFYAKHPLDPVLIAKYGVRQFRVFEERSKITGRWQKIELEPNF